jgi:hypothetical protein
VAGDPVWVDKATANRSELTEESDDRAAPELDDARSRYYRLSASGCSTPNMSAWRTWFAQFESSKSWRRNEYLRFRTSSNFMEQR